MKKGREKHTGRWAALILLTLLLAAVCAIGAAASETGKAALNTTRLKITSTKRATLRLLNTSETVQWTSSNSKIALIKPTHKTNVIRVKALKAGKAVITAKVGKTKYTCKVVVVNKPKLSRKKKTTTEGKTFKLRVGYTVSKPVWTSDNPQVASLQRITNRTYRVFAHEAGTTTIRAKVNGKVLSCQVTVKASGQNAVSVPAGYTGWVKASGRTWFFSNGQQMKGWQRIGGYWYYFTYDGMKTNCIAGNDTGGWYYVNSEGIRVTDTQMCLAVGFIRSCSQASQSPISRLRTCFKTMCTYTYSWFPDSPGPSAFPGYAAHTFRVKIANCWRYGSAMAYVARALGFDSRVSLGGVTAHGPNYPLSAHGWCEVCVNGVWKMIDVSMQKHHPEVSLFLVPRARYPFRLQVNSTYPMTVKGTSVYWG